MILYRFLLIVCFCCCCLFGWSHNIPNVDSLQRALQKTQPDSIKVALLITLAEESTHISPSTALEYAQQGLLLAQKNHYAWGIVACMQQKGIVYYTQEHYPFALHYLLESLDICEKNSLEQEKLHTLQWISLVYAKQKNFGQSLDYGNKYLHIAEELRNRTETAKALMNIAIIYLEQDNVQRAIYYFHKAIPIFKAQQEHRYLADSYINLSNVYIAHKNYGKALTLCNAAYNLYVKLDWKKGIVLATQSYGEIYAGLGDTQRSINYYNQTIALQEMLQDNVGKVHSLNAIAQVYLTARQVTDAMIAAENSLFLAQKLEELGGMRDAYEVLYQIYKIKGDPLKALYFYELERKMADSIFNQERDKMLLVMHKNYEIEHHQHQINVLAAHKTQQSIEIKKQILIRNILFFLFLGISVLSFLLLKSNRQRKHINQELAKKNAAIALLNQELEEKVKERTAELAKTIEQLAEQNHDLNEFTSIVSHQLRQPLARAGGLLNVIELSTPDLVHLQDLRNSLNGLDTVLHHLTEILQIKNNITQQNEVVNIEQELNKVLEQQLVKELSEHHVSLKVTNKVIDTNILSIKKYINSIFFHLISNSIKYKDPRKPLVIQITLQEHDLEIITVEIKDNGLGIPDTNKLFKLYQRQHFHIEGTGLGLYLVQTQLKSIGGNISVHSQLGKGTTFKVTFKRG